MSGSARSLRRPSPVTPSTVPGAPTIATATPGDGQVSLTWAAPESNGGAALNGYAVTPHRERGRPDVPHLQLDGDLASGRPGWFNGTAYTFKVAARNVAGTGLELGGFERGHPHRSRSHRPGGAHHRYRDRWAGLG